MPDLRFQRQACGAAPRSRAPSAAEGQWALGYTEPLNKNEQSKKDDDPLNVRDRILHIYSKRGFASIDPADLRGRFRWMGLYTQRAPGLRRRQDRDARGGGARRRVLHDAGPLRRRPALRRRRPRARRDRRRLRPRHRRRHRPGEHPVPLDPDRGRPGDLGAARRRRAAPASRRAATRPRPFLGSPVAGVAADEIIDGTLRARRDQAPLHRQPGVLEPSRASSRPRSPVTPATTSRRRPTTCPSSAPSTPSTVPASTSGSAAACPPTRCSPRSSASGSRSTRSRTPGRAWPSIFRDYGYRRLRSRARLKFLVADWGVEKFREVLENEYLGRKLVPNPSPAVARRPPRPHRRPRPEGRQALRRHRADRRPGVRHPPGAARRPDRGVRRRRRPPDAVPEDRADRRRPGAASTRWSTGSTGSASPPRPSNWRRNTMACTGIEFCKLAIVDTKDRARDLVAELERRFPDLDTPITVNVNGCPNACARTQVADIGLKGQLVDARRRAGRGLPGAPRRRDRAAGQLRPQAARPQGDQRRPRRLHHQRRARTTSPTATTARRFATGSARADEELLRGDKVAGDG